jgi:DNA-directed RNA polymerase alpha subunit
MSETKIQLPEISQINENKNILSFRIAKCNVSIINAIRRTLISDIPVVAFKTEPHNDINDELSSVIIYENTTSFTNEILKQRLACIPVHIKDYDKTPLNNLVVYLDIENDTDTLKFITTEDFKIMDTTTNRELSEDIKKKIFPPSKMTKEYILFSRLKPTISKNIPGQKLKFQAKLFVSTAKESGQFNVCCTAAYKNTEDNIKQTEAWSVEEEKLEKLMLSPVEIDNKKKNWYIHDSKRYYKEDSFDFKVETIGIYTNEQLIKKSCEVLNISLIQFQKKMEEDLFEIIPDVISVKNSFDIKLTGYSYTIGKVIEYLLHEMYFKKQKILSYVGFIKKHPHDDYSIIRVVFADEDKSNIDNIKSLIYSCVDKARQIFDSINESFV